MMAHRLSELRLQSTFGIDVNTPAGQEQVMRTD